MLSPEGVLAIPLPASAGGFGFTHWETSAQPSPPWQPHTPPHDPKALSMNAQAQAQAQAHASTPRSSGSDEPGRDRAVEERRIRRMISNRESARRSRMRKQRHLEDLRVLADRLTSNKRWLANRLVAATGRCLLVCRDNDRLRSEAAALRRRLCDIRRVLIFRHLQSLVNPPPACGFMTETPLIA